MGTSDAQLTHAATQAWNNPIPATFIFATLALIFELRGQYALTRMCTQRFYKTFSNEIKFKTG